MALLSTPRRLLALGLALALSSILAARTEYVKSFSSHATTYVEPAPAATGMDRGIPMS